MLTDYSVSPQLLGENDEPLASGLYRGQKRPEESGHSHILHHYDNPLAAYPAHLLLPEKKEYLLGLDPE